MFLENMARGVSTLEDPRSEQPLPMLHVLEAQSPCERPLQPFGGTPGTTTAAATPFDGTISRPPGLLVPSGGFEATQRTADNRHNGRNGSVQILLSKIRGHGLQGTVQPESPPPPSDRSNRTWLWIVLLRIKL